MSSIPCSPTTGDGLYYVAHDVTAELVRGQNVIGVGLGKGWYWKGIGGVSQDNPSLRLELIVDFADGTQRRVASDTSWRTAVAPRCEW